MNYTYVRTKEYSKGVREVVQDNPRAFISLEETLDALSEDPKSPRLSSHPVRSQPNRNMYISDVGGRKGWRLIWELVDRTVVLLLFGEHDKVESRAERLTYEIDPVSGAVSLVEVTERIASGGARDIDQGWEVQRTKDPGRLLMAYDDKELVSHGFTEAQIHHLRPINSLDELDALRPNLGDDHWERALLLAMGEDPDAPDPAPTLLDRPEGDTTPSTRAEKVLAERITSPKSRESFSVVPAEELSDVLSKPIEDWMVFLHPDQLKLTQRPFSGPARVRGAAGTGKTVVAMHRARHLARTYPDRPVLFTTYVNNLPSVFETLFKRFAPDEAGRVEFRNIHSWAFRFLTDHGRRPTIDISGMNRAFKDALKRAPKEGVIRTRGLSEHYYREEVEWVIKGRGLDTLDAYLSLARTGRGTPLSQDHRREVWAVHERYCANLRTAGIQDFADVLLDALQLVEQGTGADTYAAVVIDEAQDLTEVGIRLLHALAGGDRRDGLFMVGDGQQSVYPGGFSLASVGIDVRGRSTLLKTNYRNTKQILAAAASIVDDTTFDDGEDVLEQGRRSVSVLRDGTAPVLAGYPTTDDHDEALVLALTEACETPDVSAGDLAVLFPSNRLVKEYEATIRSLGMATQQLTKYDGIPVDAVKVGTYQRAKGLEFKHVFLPRLEPDSIGERKRFNEDEETHAERIELLRRQLFVAMTRARDGVWAGWVGSPPALLGRTRA